MERDESHFSKSPNRDAVIQKHVRMTYNDTSKTFGQFSNSNPVTAWQSRGTHYGGQVREILEYLNLDLEKC